MLPRTHLIACDRVQIQLEKLQIYLEQINPDITAIALQAECLETCFQQEILALSDEILAPTIAHQWRVRQTEMNRLLRLLKTDLMFWQLAIKTGKKPKQAERIKDYLQKLQNFCLNPV